MQWISVVIGSGIASLFPLLLTLFILLRKQNKNAIHWSFISMVLSAIAWITTFTISNYLAFQGRPAPLLGSASGTMVLLNAVAFYVFCEFFPAGTWGVWSRRRIFLICLAGAGVVALQFSPDYMTGRRIVHGVIKAERGASFVAAGAGITIIALSGLALLFHKYWNIDDIRSRKFIQTVFATHGIIVVMVFVFTYGLPLIGLERFTFIGPTAYVFLFICLGYLIVIHRFLDIKSAVLRMALWGLFTVLPGIAFVLFFHSNVVPDLAYVKLIVTGLAFLALYFHIQYVQPRITNLFFRNQSKVEESLRAFMQELHAIGEEGGNLGIVLDRVLISLQNVLAFEKGILVTIDRFKRIVIGGKGTLPNRLERMSRMFVPRSARLSEEFAAELNQIFPLEANGSLPFENPSDLTKRYPRLVQGIRTAVNRLQAEGFLLFIPLIFKSELCGYIALGRKSNELPYYLPELSMLEAVRHSIALALRNHVYFQELLLHRDQAQERADRLSSILIQKARNARTERITADPATGKTLVFSSSVMSDVHRQVKEMARQKYPVLITGETGTGKELIARLLHGESGSEAPFVAVNCAAISRDLWESEVFGHVKGAFTDAKSDKEGLVSQAGEGALFFDEIGEMPLEIQPKILRLLQERKFRRVGDDHEQPVGCKLIFATNRDLNSMCEQKVFREDLYFRISVLSIKIPPLRERIDELPNLIEFFLPKIAGELDKDIQGIEKGALDALSRYFWPGNIRELENTMIQSILLCNTKNISFQDLPVQIQESRRLSVPAAAVETGRSDGFPIPMGDLSFDQMMDEHMTRIIHQALERSGNSGPRAAALLKMKAGKLYYRMARLGIGRN